MSTNRDGNPTEELRQLPGVDHVMAALDDHIPTRTRAQAARKAISTARTAVQSGRGRFSFQEIVTLAESHAAAHGRALLKPVINATGVLIHTNLGRAPMGKVQMDAVAEVASGYSNLEYDLTAGKRGSRYSHATALLKTLTGAESALVVNNNAGAVMLALGALCSGQEIVISRGELVEIGGEFRIPDVISAAGARLVEVGTTNRTRIADYANAVSDDTAAFLKVHPANYRIQGFTAAVKVHDLARMARSHELPLIYDLGSGLLTAPGAPDWARDEPPVTAALTDGADIVTFSCDKLLGGPQAGVIAGRSDLIARISRYPLLRALRVDKLALAALEATLRVYLEDDASELPLWKMALTSPLDLEDRAQRIIASVTKEVGRADLKMESVASISVFGGGSLPGTELSSRAISVSGAGRSTAEIERSLRHGEPAVVARVENDMVLLDLRTVAPDQDAALETVLCAILGE
ncbi:MAG: L-seryl-tRNA(Sec) selenium transferase [Actinomycetota bacterium]|nr:L-seryl-tRNA(Sec) selenium transferase [Actinomycetota bacterium]